MRIYELKIAPGSIFELAAGGDYVRVRTSAVDLTIENPEFSEKIIASAGEAYEFTQFKRLQISHDDLADQTVQLIISKGKKADSSKVGGSITIAGQNGAASQGRVSLTNVNQVIIAANASRKFLLIQNNDSSAFMRVNIAGVAATAAEGFRIAPGASFEFEHFNVTGAINAIMETATAAAGNVEYAEV